MTPPSIPIGHRAVADKLFPEKEMVGACRDDVMDESGITMTAPLLLQFCLLDCFNALQHVAAARLATPRILIALRKSILRPALAHRNKSDGNEALHHHRGKPRCASSCCQTFPIPRCKSVLNPNPRSFLQAWGLISPSISRVSDGAPA